MKNQRTGRKYLPERNPAETRQRWFVTGALVVSTALGCNLGFAVQESDSMKQSGVQALPPPSRRQEVQPTESVVPAGSAAQRKRGFAAAPAVVSAGDMGSAAASTDQSPPLQRFDIAPGPLERVLDSFRNATGLNVVPSREAIRNIQSPGVSGLYTVETALEILLAGTGVAYTFSDIRTVTLDLKGTAESVVVTDFAPATSLPRLSESVRNTPQTLSVIPRSIFEAQGATTLRDVLRNVPGLTLTAGEGGTPAGDNLTLRGFSARNDIFVDGVRDLGPQARDPFNLEQVEVVKGPGSTIAGRGSTGGMINLVSKTPRFSRSLGGSISLGTDETRRVTVDSNLPLGSRMSFRINLLGHDSKIAGRNAVENRRWGIAPSFAVHVSKRTRLIFGYYRLDQNNLSDYGIPWVPATNNVLVDYRDRPAPVPRDTFYGFRSRDRERMKANLATVTFEHDFLDRLTLRNQLRYGRSTRDSIATPPRFASNDSLVINREMRSWITEDDIWDNQTELKARFGTGSIEHSFVAGMDVSRENNSRQNRTAPNAQTTLYGPNPDDVFTGTITTTPLVSRIAGKSVALYAFDTAKLGRRWELNGSLRWDRFDAAGASTANVPVARTDRMLSSRTGIVFKPAGTGSLYAAYGTSINPSLEGLSYNTANTAIEPEKTYTLEAGSKWEFMQSRLLLTGAVFRVTKTNARTPGVLPDDPPQVLQGRQRVDGIELSATGALTSNWSLLAAYTLLDSHIVKSNTPAEIGRVLQNTPRHSLSIWSTYAVRRLTLGGGARFVGLRYGNNSNSRQVDGFWLLDAMATYPLNRRLDLRINLQNAANTYYFDRLGGGHLIPGPARSLSVGTSLRF